jgi:hypothetical protein
MKLRNHLKDNSQTEKVQKLIIQILNYVNLLRSHRHATLHHTSCIHEIILKPTQNISRLSQHTFSDSTEIVPAGTEKWILEEEISG